MGRAHIVDPDTERPPEISGLPVFDRVVSPGGHEPDVPISSDAGTLIGVLRLPFEMRARSRLRARLMAGGDVAVVLPRGTVLRGGALVAGQGGFIRVEAADEDIVTVRAANAVGLARAAYHLGNRHVPVQVLRDALLIGYDAVLVDMLIRLGVRTQRGWAPFEPEAGAYGHGAGHGH